MEDVLAWNLQACEAIRISKRSSFEPGAQGLALASLAALDPRSQAPTLVCDFEEPLTGAAFEETLFASGFGTALSRLVPRIEFLGSASSEGFKVLLAAAYKANEGIFGAGSSMSVVCPDHVFSLPPALTRLGDGTDDYPAPSAFQLLLTRLVQRMGFKRLLSSAEESSVVAFIYEALRNSQEHGITADPVRRRRSTRTLIVEKLVLQGDLTQRQLSPQLKAYLERIVEFHRGDLGLGVVCITVADQGDGIQATLPAKEGETPVQRLARAFEPGESRKPAGIVSRGLGLPSVIASAHRLQALVRITSGSLQVGQDFSLAVEKYPKLDFDSVVELSDGLRRGTSVSIFFPELGFDIDQAPLFS